MSQKPHSLPPIDDNATKPIQLPWWERLSFVLVAVVFIILAGFFLYNPPKFTTIKQNGQGQVIESTTTSTSDGAVAIAIYGTGIVILLFALNGLRLAKFSFGNFAAESVPVSQARETARVSSEIAKVPPEKITEVERQLITDDDVVAAFATISQNFPDGVDLSSMSAQLRVLLLLNGIATKHQLNELALSPAILNTLRSLYVRVLRRDKDKPLDPIAVAVWGALLYRLGVNQNSIRVLESELRASQEYRDKVANETIRPD
jgi:succinate dehydrogenase/fumarate reductase cytochrome b subunit